MSNSNMRDILKKINLIESSVEECGGDMGSMNSMPSQPSTPVTLNMSAGSASEMSQMLKALANIDDGKCLAELITNIIATPLNTPPPIFIIKSSKGIGL